jgi:hypothetical protein
MSQETELAILGLTRPEALDLRKSLVDCDEVRIEEAPIDDSSAGVLDPVSIVVVALGVTGIQGLIAWALKDRNKEQIIQKIELRRPDGTIERRSVTLSRSTSTAGDNVKDILKSLELPDLM